MKYDALTFDTQVFDSNGKRLNTGILGALAKYGKTPYQIILSEITLREIHRHILVELIGIRVGLEKSLRSGKNLEFYSSDVAKGIQDSVALFPDPNAKAKEIVTEYTKNTNAVVIRANTVGVDAVLKSYFNKTAPFGPGGKKSEFPDAFALLSLEKWAEDSDLKILAVSKDKDWIRYADSSSRIDVVDNLANAIEELDNAISGVEPLVRKIFENIVKADTPEQKSFEEHVTDAVSNETPYIEFDSNFNGEEEGATLNMTSYDILDGNSLTDVEPQIIRAGTKGLVFSMPIIINVDVEADISFSIRDSVDKDYVPMGSTTIFTNTEFEAEALVSCFKIVDDDGLETEDKYEIESVELINTPMSVDIGYVDFDPGDDDYYHN